MRGLEIWKKYWEIDWMWSRKYQKRIMVNWRIRSRGWNLTSKGSPKERPFKINPWPNLQWWTIEYNSNNPCWKIPGRDFWLGSPDWSQKCWPPKPSLQNRSRIWNRRTKQVNNVAMITGEKQSMRSGESRQKSVLLKSPKKPSRIWQGHWNWNWRSWPPKNRSNHNIPNWRKPWRKWKGSITKWGWRSSLWSVYRTEWNPKMGW